MAHLPPYLKGLLMELSLTVIILVVLAYIVLKPVFASLISTATNVVGYAEERSKVLEPLAGKQNELDLHAIDAELKKFKAGLEL